jgi:hypothetical protein
MRPNRHVRPVGGVFENARPVEPPPPQVPPETIDAGFLRRLFGTTEKYQAVLDKQAALARTLFGAQPVDEHNATTAALDAEAEAATRKSLDKKQAAMRAKTLKKKVAKILLDFRKLRAKFQVYEQISDSLIVEVLTTDHTALRAMSSHPGWWNAAMKFVTQYYEATLDGADLHESAGWVRKDGSVADATGRGDKVTGATNRTLTGGYDIEGILQHAEDDENAAEGRKVKPKGAGPDDFTEGEGQDNR